MTTSGIVILSAAKNLASHPGNHRLLSTCQICSVALSYVRQSQAYPFILFLYVEVESSMATRTRKRKVGTRFIASGSAASTRTTPGISPPHPLYPLLLAPLLLRPAAPALARVKT